MATYLGHDALDHAQTKSRSFARGLRREEGLEKMRKDLGSDPATIVGELQVDLAASPCPKNAEPMFPRPIRRLDGILSQNEEDLLDILSIREDGRQLVKLIPIQSNMGFVCALLQQPYDPLSHDR
jgi:hypothetical protein